MKKFKTITNTIITILSGITFSSLCITQSELWRYSLSIILLIISLRMNIDYYDSSKKEEQDKYNKLF